MIYKNALVMIDEPVFARRDVCIRNGLICETTSDEKCVDASDYYVIPALSDIHSHGACGVCANDGTEESFQTMDRHMIKSGVLSFLPTAITADIQEMNYICRKYAAYKKSHTTPSIGLNLEGPFINAAKKGAHNQKYIINPDIELFKKMFDASEGLIRLVTVAPELPSALAFIKEVSKLCRVAIGHSVADYDMAMRAFEAGASDVTHLFNAMNPLGQRAPGIVAAARDSDAYVELICDGHHVHPAVIRMVFSAFNKNRVVIISDAISATGLEDGEYELGGLKTIVGNGVSTLEDGTLAGSTTDLLKCIKNVVEFGISIEDAVHAASHNPNRLINNKSDQAIILDKDLGLVDQ